MTGYRSEGPLRWRWRRLHVALVVVGCTLAMGSAAAPAAAARRPAACTTRTERQWIRCTIGRMNLAEEVGQLFEVDGYGQAVRDGSPANVKLNRGYYGVRNIAELISRYHLGGIIYFDWSNNLQNPAQIVRLSNGIQKVAARQRVPVPMVISTDQEQGEVLRIGPPATVFPGNMALGATRSLAMAAQAASITGVELRAMGVNVDNAPVVDVNIDPLDQADGIRAYGDRVPLVSSMGAAQIRSYQARQSTRGVGATAKHWPGFGDTSINSDTGIAVSPQTLAQVKRTNLPSFRAAIRAGVDRIMVTHILFPKVTGRRFPTSLSPFWVNGLLRGSLHYRGPVVTDALDAAAVARFPAGEVALRALRAGDDELLEIAQTGVDKGRADLLAGYKAVLHAVCTRAITKARLDLSVTRILSLKWKLGLVRNPYANPGRVRSVVGIPSHLAAARRITARSITLVRNSANLLPLAAESGKRVLVAGIPQVTIIGQGLTAHGLKPQVLDTGISPTAAMIRAAVKAAAANDLVIVAPFNAWSYPSQLALVRALIATGKPVIVAAVGTPYDVAYVPTASTFITSLDYQPVSVTALTPALFGEVRPSGRLPVTITEPPPSTRVLYPFGFGLGFAP